MNNNHARNIDLLNLDPLDNNLASNDSITPQVVSFDRALSLTSNTISELEKISEQIIEQAQNYLTEFAQNPAWEAAAGNIFGDTYSANAFQNIVNDFAVGNFSNLPQIKIVDGQDLQGADGGYDDSNDLIYLSGDFILANQQNFDAVTRVLLEEIGHSIDTSINQLDSLGDEGAMFSAIVTGRKFAEGLLDENDFSEIIIDGQQVIIEQSNSDLAGNNLANARDLGIFTGGRTFRDRVTNSDRNDYYKFTLDTPGRINFGLTGLSANANIMLIDANGKGITGGYRGGKSSEFGSKENLEAGDYYLRVFQKTGNTNYNLILNFDGAGDNLDSARDLGTFTGGRTFKDRVTNSDRNDYYKFTLDTPGRINFGLTGLSGNANIVLIDSNGNGITGGYRGGNSNEFGSKENLAAGDYYLRVFQKTGNTNYNLILNFDGAGNNLDSARDLGTFTDKQTFKDRITNGDRQDYYKFAIDSTSKVSFALTGLSANADIMLIDSNGNAIAGGYRGGTRNEFGVKEDLAAGDYYLRVFQKTGITNYNLTLNVEPTEEPEIQYSSNELLVKLKPGSSTNISSFDFDPTQQYQVENVESLIPVTNSQGSSLNSFSLEEESSLSQWRVFSFQSGTNIEDAQEYFSNSGNYEKVEYNYKLSTNWTPNDPNLNQLWGLNNTGQFNGTLDADIDAVEAWNVQKGSRSVTVAVIDTGVDYTHQDLAANMWRNPGEIAGNGIDDDLNGFIDDIYGYDFAENNATPMDDFIGGGHGTHVAGTIGAVGNNNLGIIGVSPNVNIMALNFMSSEEVEGDYRVSGYTSDAIRAVYYAADMGADVINASFGGGGKSRLMEDAQK